MKRSIAAALLAAGLVLVAAGCHHQAGPQNNPPPAAPPTGTGPSAAGPSSTAPAKVAVYVLNPKATSEETLLMPREITVRHPNAPVKDAVTALLAAKRSPLAPGVSLRGLAIDGGVATLDFSGNPIKPGGEGDQSASLNAMAMTLGQFPEINQYQIKVQGRSVQSFGEFSADGPMDVTRPGAALEAKGGGQ